MDERNTQSKTPSTPQQGEPNAARPSSDSTGAMPPSSTGSIPAASGTGSLPHTPDPNSTGASSRTVSTQEAPRYVRHRAPHRSQGSLDDLSDENMPSAGYTHDSNISVGGSTPLSGMAYRRSRSNMTRVKNGSRYGQYLEIPKGRRSIFASRERQRRRRSVLALIAVIAVLVIAGLLVWNLFQSVLG